MDEEKAGEPVEFEVSVLVPDLKLILELATLTEDRSVSEQIAMNRIGMVLDTALPWMQDWMDARVAHQHGAYTQDALEMNGLPYRICRGCGLPISEEAYENSSSHTVSDVTEGEPLPEDEWGEYHGMCCPVCRAEKEMAYVDAVREANRVS